MKSKIRILIAALCVCAAAFAGVWAFALNGLGFDSYGRIVLPKKKIIPN